MQIVFEHNTIETSKITSHFTVIAKITSTGLLEVMKVVSTMLS